MIDVEKVISKGAQDRQRAAVENDEVLQNGAAEKKGNPLIWVAVAVVALAAGVWFWMKNRNEGVST
jgi:uncharacterized protein HemX